MRPSQTATWPAPTMGLLRNGALVGAPVNAAEELDNFIPTATGVRLRGGIVLRATTAAAAGRLMVYRSGAVEQLFAAETTKVTDISSPASATVAETPEMIGLTSSDWSTVQFGTAGGQFMLMVNGSDLYRYFDGTAFYPVNAAAVNKVAYDAKTVDFIPGRTLTGGTSGATSTILSVNPITNTTGTLYIGAITGGPYQDNETLTGSSTGGSATANGASTSASSVVVTGIDTDDLSFVWIHKTRVWFVEKNTLNSWYLPTNAFGGAATKFPLTGVFKLGGALLFGGTWSVDSGSGLDDVQVFVTTEGEVAVYQGTDPSSAATWALTGVYRIGKPLNKNAWFQAGTDFFIVTQEGIVSVSEVMAKDRAGVMASALTVKIEELWRQQVALDASHPFPVVYWAKEALIFVGLPSQTGQNVAFVADVRSGSWARILGWDVRAARVFSDNLYIAGASGAIYQADEGGTDAGTTIVGVWTPKGQDFGLPTDKAALHARAIWRADVQAKVRLSAVMNYASGASVTLPPVMDESEIGTWGTVGQKWGSRKWGSLRTFVAGSAWQAVSGLGFAISPRLVVASNRTAKPAFEPSSLQVRFEVSAGL